MLEKRRIAGILLPVSALPSRGGIGGLGKAAFEFVDFLHKAGQSCWQVLPVGPTGFGDSPYQSFSAFAGNPYFIDLDELESRGLITAQELAQYDATVSADAVDYGLVYQKRFPLLRLAASRFERSDPSFAAFCAQNRDWLDDYAAFMAIKEHFGGRQFTLWDEDIRLRRPEAMKKYAELLADDIYFWKFTQYFFFTQWDALRAYAAEKNISIIGDIPIYVAMDSADVWANPSLFLLDEKRLPTCVAGVPPDYFSATGQRWGNPIYDWKKHERTGFAWWKKRVAASARLYDIIRIDHFIGIARYYKIAAECPTAIDGEWLTGPGKKLINAINSARGNSRILAEDLGVLHPTVKKLLALSGYPGMKVLLFAADGSADNPYVPFGFERNTAVYVGTHDNDTALGFVRSRSDGELEFLCKYFNADGREQLPQALIKGALECHADTAVIQLQDWLGLDNSARINTPSTVGENWKWRLDPAALSDGLAAHIADLTRVYGRLNCD